MANTGPVYDLDNRVALWCDHRTQDVIFDAPRMFCTLDADAARVVAHLLTEPDGAARKRLSHALISASTDLER